MSGSRRDRTRKAARREPFRAPKPKILIVCEGQNSEPQYLDGFWKACKNSRVDVIIPKGGRAPLAVVQYAKDLKQKAEKAARREHDENLSYDRVWGVFDVNSHPNIPDARLLAKQYGIQLAISNPCFELWLLLHHRESPGANRRDDIKAMLKLAISNYDKSVDYRDYEDGYLRAVSQATRLDELAEQIGDPGKNPTTGVYRLTEEIRE